MLKLADCGTNDWRFYEDRKAYVSGLVQGSDKTDMHIAVWESSKDIYTPGANVKLVSKPFDGFKNDYGAEWIKKSASVRSVNRCLLKSLLSRTFSGNSLLLDKRSDNGTYADDLVMCTVVGGFSTF